jgi:hypothetical protein
MKRFFTSLALLALLCAGTAVAVPVKVTMNATSTIMSLADKATGTAVNVGEATNRVYSFDALPGTYVLTGYAKDSTTVNGTIELTVADTEEEQAFSLFTHTVYATNKEWAVDTDYTIDVSVCSREGDVHVLTLGNSTIAGRKTFLTFSGNSYYVSLIPSATHQEEGYMTFFKSGTITFNTTVSGIIPMGADYTITLPSDANLTLGIKGAHFISFTTVEPKSTVVNGSTKDVTYRLADNQVYNYRTSREGGLTQGGYFTMKIDETKRPQLAFTDADYEAFGPKTIKHDVQWNDGYETGDIFVNINERGHLKLNQTTHKEFDLHAMRTWQLTDNSFNNYFIEPDFHYAVIGLDGQPLDDVIRITPYPGDPWAKIEAIGQGTAIVLVTYDAIGLNYYSGTNRTPYLGGEYWSAIWPENTGVFVVTVDAEEAVLSPNMIINEEYNEDTKKNAGKYVDAEHDVFYYLDTEEGFTYTFTPESVNTVEMAYPTIGAQSATYNGFGTTGVTKNSDGSWSLLLKEGRQIVRLTDASGRCSYQVLTAKPCHREISNATRPGSNIYQPGDKVKVQYSGLRHPANKLAGIYNMSAYVTYNGIPNGTSLILGSGQYTFGSAASAQAVAIDIPADYDIDAGPLVMDKGVIQVNGFGDPIGNHRFISRIAGRSPNFTAIAHKTYFGAIPSVSIPVSAVKNFIIRPVCNVEDATYAITLNGNAVTNNGDGTYTGTFGTYAVVTSKAGYRCSRSTFNIADDAEGEQVFNISLLAAAAGAWDGTAKTEPAKEGDIYQIGNAAELAWFADIVNTGTEVNANAVLTADIELADYEWTPIGNNNSTTQFKGLFDGQGHAVRGLYISGTNSYQGLIGYVNEATIKNLKVYGEVHGGSSVGGIVGYATGACTFDRLENHADVYATNANSYVAGVVGRVNTATTVLTNCINYGSITGTNYVGGILNYGTTAKDVTVTHVVNAGEITGVQTGAIRGWYKATEESGSNITNAFAVTGYFNDLRTTLVTTEQMASGEVAYLLGEAWGQEIGTDAYPVLGGKKVIIIDGQYVNSLNEVKDYELAVLSFEEDIWDALIDSPQYGGKLLYGESGQGYDNHDKIYKWTDPVTHLYNELSEGYGMWCYWSGGHAVSNYASGEITTYGDYTSQLTVYKQGVSGLARTGGGHNGSDKFAVHFGYADNSGWGLTEESLPSLLFKDGQARVIDHMYVTNTCYAVNCYLDGNGLTAKIGPDDWVKIVATGYDENGTKSSTAEIYLCNGPEQIVTDWTKFDLSGLGKVLKVTFNITGSSDNGYGFSQPAYFAYDDVAVRMPRALGAYTLEDKSEYTLDHTLDVEELTYTRTFGTDLWQPLYVPFTSDYTAWKDDVIIAKAVQVGDTYVEVVELTGDESVVANTPYFIKARQTGNVGIVVSNATLQPAASGTTTCAGLTLTGVYAPTAIPSGDHSVLHNGELVKSTGTYNLPSMRWYADGLTFSSGAIRFRDGNLTTLQTLDGDVTIEAIYDAGGTQQQTLQQGINIVRMSDGTVRKVFIR